MNEDEATRCDVCGRRFGSEDELERHIDEQGLIH